MENTDIPLILVTLISIGVSALFSVVTLVLSFLVWRHQTRKWLEDRQREDTGNRLEILRDLFSDFSRHNWKFIEWWDFPGVYPNVDSVRKVVPEKSSEFMVAMGQRVVTLEHLNILLKVYSHKSILFPHDLVGFKNWALSWYHDSKEALRIVFEDGDTYPLDFIEWLRTEIIQDSEFDKLYGKVLATRIRAWKENNSERTN